MNLIAFQICKSYKKILFSRCLQVIHYFSFAYLKEASKTTDIKDVEHIIEKKTAGDVMESIVHKWDAQKNDFYEKTDMIIRPDQLVAAIEDNFDKELENILGEWIPFWWIYVFLF